MTTNINDILEVAARTEYNGVEDVINVYQWQLTTPGPVTDGQTVTDIVAIMEALYGLYVAIQTAVIVYRDLRIKNVTQNRLLGVHPWPTLTVGGSAAVPLPPGNSAVINLATDISRVVMRKFIGGLTVSNIEADGSMNATATATIATIGTFLLLINAQVGGNYRYGHLSAKTAAFEFPNSAVVTDITGYQRRRKQGRGS